LKKVENIIGNFFSNEANSIEITEDFFEAKIHIQLSVTKFPTDELYIELLGKISERDTFHLSIKNEGEVVENFTNRNDDDDFQSYIDLIQQNVDVGDVIELILTIEKKAVQNKLSIYFLQHFIRQLNDLSFLSFLSGINDRISNSVFLFECLEEKTAKTLFSTNTIQFIGKDGKSTIKEFEKEIRSKRIDTASSLCLWDISEKKILLPDDFYPIQSTSTFDELKKTFLKVALLYTNLFVFDYLSIKEKQFIYKLNGYKTFGNKILTSQVSNIDIDINSTSIFYQIYEWIYSGGNTTDKISIARNIISLNFNPTTLSLSETTFDSILSNFKIYERQSVQQYIEVRNKLSELLINLQERIDKIVNNFISDFKKNIITLLSFFTSVIVLRVISKGDFIGGFTPEIIILSYSFLCISIGILLYSRWELSQRTALFDKHYSQLKDRYKELLTDNEIENIFDQQNPKNINNKSFVKKQKNLYTILWVVSICILSLALAIIYDDFILIHQISAFFNRIKLLFQG